MRALAMVFAGLFGLLFASYWPPSGPDQFRFCAVVLLGCLALSLILKRLPVKVGIKVLMAVGLLAAAILWWAFRDVRTGAIVILPVGISLVNLVNRRNNYVDAMSGAWVFFRQVKALSLLLLRRVAVGLFGYDMAITLFGRRLIVGEVTDQPYLWT
jgi:hypothetical protein